MKILCIKDIISRSTQMGELEKEKFFSKGNIYETYPFKMKTQLYANDDTESMHCLGWLDEDGTLEDENGWFQEHFKVISK